MNTFISAYLQADLFGKAIFLSLFALSIICWIILVQKIWMTTRIAKTSDSFQNSLAKLRKPFLSIEIGDLPRPSTKEIPHPLGAIFTSLKIKTIEILKKNSQHFMGEKKPVFLSQADVDLLESYVLTTISSQVKTLEKNLFVLTTIISLAPFLGLLGTVWGILLTFSGLESGVSLNSNTLMLQGLSTALTTTVLGLVIAIPALISYNYLKAKIRHLTSDMQDFFYQQLSSLETQYRKVDLS